jgi:hypothetical protein
MSTPGVFARRLLIILLATAAGAGAQEEVIARNSRGTPTFIRGDLGTLVPARDYFRASDREQTAYLREVATFAHHFAQRNLAASGDEELVVGRVAGDPLGTFHVRW